MPNRAVAFVDGNNWYHCAKRAGFDPADLDIVKVVAKASRTRELVGVRYYIGQVPQSGNLRLHADQQRYLSRLKNSDPRVEIRLGRIEPRPSKSEAAAELLDYLGQLRVRIDQAVYQELLALGRRHKLANYMVEKGVDVMLAVDLVTMAQRDEFDAAYLVSADGDYTHAAQFVRQRGKRVFAVSPGYGAQLAAAVDSFIHINAEWLADCRT